MSPGLSGVSAQAAAAFELQGEERILFMGDTMLEREGDYGLIEAHLTARFPDRNLTFRNLAWAADTPEGRSRASFDWNKTPEDWLKRVREQLQDIGPTIAVLDYGTTAALEGADVPRFKEGLNRLMDLIEEVAGHKVKFVLLAPAARARMVEPSARRLHGRLEAVAGALESLATERNAWFVRLSDLPASTAGLANGDPLLPAEEAYPAVADRIVRTLFGGSPAGLPDGGPESESFLILRTAIQRKNELFFNRWRPANWTYLFGFRKHEQGQNAVEIPRFDPLIAEWEARIERLRDLKNQDPATVSEVRASRTAPAPAAAPGQSQPRPVFDVAEGFEASLWAEDPLLHKPIQMNWDARGRLWIASSEVYPQIQPGQRPVDSVLVLEDTDGDGRADKSTVFVEGLMIPTGVAPDNRGGCYVAASHQLLHFADTDGDGKADTRTIVLSSFGTEDTHHNLHTLRWGYDGRLYMNQSIYTHSHVETPHGVARLNSGGIWRFDPSALRLEVFTRGGCNPWGHHWDAHGNSFFTDGAGFKGLYHAIEGATYFTYADMRREAESTTPGNWPKFCGLEIIRSAAFPSDWQGDAITCDFRAHRIVRFRIESAGSTYTGKEMPDLLRSTAVSFRPIDVRLGPDGALYIADWSNPIIQHGEVDFRDPRRDKEHGRIWRVAAAGTATRTSRDLTALETSRLLDLTLDGSGWEVEQARRVLAVREQSATLAAASQWLKSQQRPEAALEAAWLAEAFGESGTEALSQAAASDEGKIRAASARLAAWQAKRIDPEDAAGREAMLNQLAKFSVDPDPRVRLAALRGLAAIPTSRAAELALAVLDRPMDAALDYALWMTINDLADPWVKALQSGQWKPEGREKQLEFALKAIKPEQSGRVLSGLLKQRPLTRDGSGPWIELIGAAGSPAELSLLLEQLLAGGFDEDASVRAIRALADATRLRKVRPGDLSVEAGKLLENPDERVRLEAVRLAGLWKDSSEIVPKLLRIAVEPSTSPEMRSAVLQSLGQIGGAEAMNGLGALTISGHDPALRRAAALALARLDLDKGRPALIEVMRTTPAEADALEFWRGILAIKGADQAMREAFPENSLHGAAARAGMRAAREGGRDDIDLVVALARAGGLKADAQAVTAEVLKDLSERAMTQGDPQRGERVYRRPELACLTCHAIGGAGGRVGPDLTSIGASAPVDYLVEALLLPNAKIKEGYHSLNIETRDGQSLSGTLASETQDEIVLRTAANAEVRIPKTQIESRETGLLSIMPAGLMDGLKEQDKLDLIAFLSRLGKPGEFDASRGGIARQWRVNVFTHTDQQHDRQRNVWEKPLADAMWQPVGSLVNGRLTRSLIEETAKRQFWVGTIHLFVATEIQVPNPGTVKLNLDTSAGELWVEGRKIGGPGEHALELPAGKHRVVVRLDPRSLPDSLRLESPDAAFLMN